MTIGAGTFNPAGNFAFPRSYISGIQIATAGFALTQMGNSFALNFQPTYVTIFYFSFTNEFYDSSTNAYTLDHIVETMYYKQFPTDTEHALPYGLRWVRLSTTHHPVLQFAPNLNYDNLVDVAFPANPPGYWTEPT